MRYSVLGFNQELVMELVNETGVTIDLTDLLLLDYIQGACGQPSMCREVKDDQVYVWLQHEKLLTDLPILDIKTNMFGKRMRKLRKLELVDYIMLQNKAGRGSRTYYAITKKAESLRYTTTSNTLRTKSTTTSNTLRTKSTTTSNTLRVEQGPEVKKYAPNSQLNNNSKLDKDSILSNSEKTSFSHSQNNNNDFSLNNKPKQKKENLWDKCFNELGKFTKDENLKNKLIEYLNVWIKLKDKHPNLRNWQSILKKLQSEYIKDDWIAIIDQSIRKEYATFCPLSSTGNKKQKKLFDEGIRNDGRYDLDDHSLTDIEF